MSGSSEFPLHTEDTLSEGSLPVLEDVVGDIQPDHHLLTEFTSSTVPPPTPSLMSGASSLLQQQLNSQPPGHSNDYSFTHADISSMKNSTHSTHSVASALLGHFDSPWTLIPVALIMVFLLVGWIFRNKISNLYNSLEMALLGSTEPFDYIEEGGGGGGGDCKKSGAQRGNGGRRMARGRRRSRRIAGGVEPLPTEEASSARLLRASKSQTDLTMNDEDFPDSSKDFVTIKL